MCERLEFTSLPDAALKSPLPLRQVSHWSSYLTTSKSTLWLISSPPPILGREGFLMWLWGLLYATFIALAGTGVNLSHKEEYLDYSLAMIFKVWLIFLSVSSPPSPQHQRGNSACWCVCVVVVVVGVNEQNIIILSESFLLLVLQRHKHNWFCWN